MATVRTVDHLGAQLKLLYKYTYRLWSVTIQRLISQDSITSLTLSFKNSSNQALWKLFHLWTVTIWRIFLMLTKESSNLSVKKAFLLVDHNILTNFIECFQQEKTWNQFGLAHCDSLTSFFLRWKQNGNFFSSVIKTSFSYCTATI